MSERAHRTPIDPVFLSHQIGAALDDNCVVIDETLAPSQLRSFLRSERPASYFGNPASAGGWSPGAAFGAKLAAPERDIVAVAGDGFYMFGTPQAALWSAAHYRAPFLQIIYQNRSYSTGTSRVAAAFPDGYAARSGYDGAYFDPPTDFAKEAEANGAYGENVRDPADIIPAIHRGLAKTRSGIPAVIAVWLPRIFEKD